jgi:hypothetical protein
MSVMAMFGVGLLLGLVVVRLASLWWKNSGRRVVTCPENKRPAGVSLNAGRAAFTGMSFRQDLRLAECSRWPERAGCGQECLRQIESAPDGCLVRNILVKWCEGKTCQSCGRPIGPVVPGAAQPAVISADRVSVEWSDIPAEQLLDTLSAGQPVCFACHTASKMMREHPELVTDRSQPAYSSTTKPGGSSCSGGS